MLSQVALLSKLGLLTQVGVKGRAIELNQLLYRCNLKWRFPFGVTNRKSYVVNIAKNIGFDVVPFM